MKTLINPDGVEAFDTMKKQHKKIYDLERKLKDTRPTTNNFFLNLKKKFQQKMQ